MPEIKLDLRTATMIVAANDSLHKNMANYVCDGVNDDVEIQAALNAVALPGVMGRVILLDGTFHCATDVLVPNRTTLEGQGYNTILNFAGAAIANAITLAGDDIQVKNLRAELAAGAGIGNGAATRPNVVYGNGRSQVLLENLLIYGDETVADDNSDLNQCGILIVDSYNPKIINCIVRDCDRHGIHLNNTESGIIKGNTSNSNGHWGILVYNGSDWNILVGNQCYINGHGGINIATSFDCDITGNTCNNNTLHGILLYQAERIVVSGCTCIDNDAHGINLEESVECTISGNLCVENDHLDTGNYDGINVGNVCSRINVVGNYCGENHRYGIFSQGFPTNIVGNYVYKNDQEGIYVVGPYTAIKANYIYINGQDAAGTYHGIYCSGTDCSIIANTIEDIGSHMDDGIHLPSGGDRIQINDNYIHDLTGDGIQLTANNDDCMIKDNYIHHCDGFGINIVAGTCVRTIVENNKLLANGGGAINDAGTDTILPFIYEPVHNPDAFIGNHPAEDLPDNVVTTTRLSLYVPTEFQELVRIQVFVVAALAGDLNYDVDTDYGKVCADEVYNLHGAAVAGQIHTCAINDIECVDLMPATTLASLAAQDLVGIQFTRDGVDVTDTIAGHVYLIGVRMQYV